MRPSSKVGPAMAGPTEPVPPGLSMGESRNSLCLGRVYRVMDARGKLGEHERSVRVVQGEAECFSSFSSALPTSQLHP